MMNYTDKIEAYTTGKMPALEQLVFEQELAENGSLKEAFEAHQLTETLLGFTANNLSEAAILGNVPIPQTELSANSSNAMYYGASLLALCLIGLFAYIYTPSSSAIETSPTVEAKQTIPTPTVNIAKPHNQPVKETIIFQDPIQEIKPTQKPTPTTPARIKTKKINQPKPIAAVKKKVRVNTPITKTVPVLAANVTSTKKVNSGEAIVFTAGESITFGPGFSVEAGGSLQAKIETIALNR